MQEFSPASTAFDALPRAGLSRRRFLSGLASAAAFGGEFLQAADAPAGPRELFRDPQFAEGFGAAWPYGERFSAGPRDGKLLAYRDIAPYRVHLIPEGPVQPGDAREHAWDFEEGPHQDFTDPFGNRVVELHEHRFAVNHVLEENSPDRLQFAQYNNYRLTPDDASRNQKLVKRVSTDRRGTLRMCYNTQNEIRNVATAYTSQWASDTWPHLLLVQRFIERPCLREFQRLDFSLTYRVDRVKSLSDWPSKQPGASPPDMCLPCYFLLCDPTAKPLWVGLLLYASNPDNYFVHTAREQWGMAFYREPRGELGRQIALGQPHTVTCELKSLVGKALASVAAKFGPGLVDDVDQYRLVLFNIGWEGIGHWECDGELSGLSLLGLPTPPPPSTQGGV